MTTPTLRFVPVAGGASRLQRVALAILGLALATPLPAQRVVEKKFNVPAGDAAATLPRFVEQAGEQLAYLVDNVRGEKTNSIAGQFTVLQALNRMLAGSNLIATEDKSTGALMVGRKNASANPPKRPERREPGIGPKPPLLREKAATDEERVLLPAFTVSSFQDKGYLAGNSVSGTRIDTPIKDLPFSINAFTRQFISDIGARELGDIVQYAPGVTSGARQLVNANASYMIRGFQQAPQINGFSSPNASGTGGPYIDAAAIDRVEIVKGPASMLYGQVAPGGTVNFLTKRAEPKAISVFSVKTGTYGFWRGTVDLNQPLVSATLLFRLNAAYENGTEYVDHAASRTTVLVPSILWQITKRLRLKVDYHDFRRREAAPVQHKPFIELVAAAPTTGTNANVVPTAGVLQNPLDLSDPGFLLYYPLSRRFNLVSPHDWRHTHFQTIAAEFAFKITDRWITRTNVSQNKGYNGFKSTGITSINLDVPAAFTSQFPTYAVAARAFAAAIVADPAAALTAPHAQNVRRQLMRENINHNTALQAEAVGSLHLGDVKAQPLFGAFYDGGKAFDRRRQTGTNGTYTIFTAPSVGNRFALQPTIWDFHHQELFPIVTDTDFNPVALPLTTYTGVHAHTRAAYAILSTTSMDGRLVTILGARYNASEAKVTNFLTNPDVVSAMNPTFTPAYRARRVTPQIAAGYKLRRDLSVFTSYSESYQANTFLKSGDQPGVTAKPTTSKGYEVGIKTDLLEGRVSSTISVYQIEQRDRVISLNVANASGAVGSFDFQGTVDRSRGIEAEVTLSPRDNWQIYANISEMDIRTVGVALGLGVYLGGHPQSTAKTMANLWSRYSFPSGRVKGLWVGAGINYISPKAGMALNYAQVLPATTLVNAACGYDWKWTRHAWSAMVNWENITNVEYFPSIQDRGLPERMSVTITARL